jgi:two-component system sensor histidine kinase/response regulator
MIFKVKNLFLYAFCEEHSFVQEEKEEPRSIFKVDVKQPSVQGTNGEKGSRLGLILCKEFIDKHKGEISLISEPNIGTEFTIKLPAVK